MGVGSNTTSDTMDGIEAPSGLCRPLESVGVGSNRTYDTLMLSKPFPRKTTAHSEAKNIGFKWLKSFQIILQGLFHRAIGQSGSAVSPWAFDFEPEFHARRIAKKLGCDAAEQKDIVLCMKTKNSTEITIAHSEYVVSIGDILSKISLYKAMRS